MSKEEKKESENLTVNVIKGEKANVILYHKGDNNVVMDEVNKAASKRELMSVLANVAEKGITDARVFVWKDTRRSSDCLYLWGKTQNSRMKLYVANNGSHGGKPLYIVYGVGEHERQTSGRDADLMRAYARQGQMAEMLKRNVLNLDTLLGENPQPQQQPKSVAHHKTKGDKKQKQKQKA